MALGGGATPTALARLIPTASRPVPGAPTANAGMAAPPPPPPPPPPAATTGAPSFQGAPTNGRMGTPPPSSGPPVPLPRASFSTPTDTPGLGAPPSYVGTIDKFSQSAFPATINPPAPVAPPGEGFGPGFGEKYGKDHIGNYDQPTALEQFYQQQLTGDNPYYQRLQQQQSDQINQQMAARGHYNSGGAMAALGNASGALYADQFANMGNLAGQASTLQLNRYGQGFAQAQGVQGMQQGRINSQFAQASDIAHLGAGSYGGFYTNGGNMSGDAAMSGINAGTNAAQLTGQGQGAFTNLAVDGIKAGIGAPPSGGGGGGGYRY